MTVLIIGASVFGCPPAIGKAFISDDFAHYRAGQFDLKIPATDGAMSFRTPLRTQVSALRPDAAAVFSAVTGVPSTQSEERRSVPASMVVAAAFPPCAIPATGVPRATKGLVALPGTPGVAGDMQPDRHALLARRAFLHGCESAAAPCTGFDAAPIVRPERPRAIPRLSLALSVSPIRRANWAVSNAMPEMVVRDYVDVVELIAIQRWHGSIMAPLVRVAMLADAPTGAPVVIADDAPGRLDVGDTLDLNLLDMAGGWYRRVSEREMLALLALGLAPVRRRKTS